MAKLQYKHYALLLLTVVSVFNYLDRGIVALAMEPIKAEFQLSDSQLGLMTGLAFAFFYAIAGIPIARWADRGNRNHVIALTATLCSVMLMLCSMAGSFLQLLLARVGVGVGEAGCVPPAQSLLSDYFDRAERPRAMAIYWLGAAIAAMLSYVAGGWLIDQFGWRYTFMMIALPGMVLAIVVKLTLREPRTEKENAVDAIDVATDVTTVVAPAQPSMREVLTILWKGAAFRHLLMAYCISTFLGNGIFAWMPTFFIRSYDMNVTEIGIWIGFGVGGGGMLFTYLGGYLAARYAPSKEAWHMKGMAVLIVLAMVFHILCCLAGNKMASMFMLIGFAGCLMMIVAPQFAAIQSLVAERMRAVAVAFILMLSHLIGLGLGPLLIGVISDGLAPEFGQESLRYTMLIISPGFLWCAFHAWKASSTIEDDIRVVEEAAQLTKVQQNVAPAVESTSSNFSTVG